MLLQISDRFGFAALEPNLLVRALHACALMRRPPPRDWLDGCLAALGGGCLEQLTPQSLANAAWALAALDAHPGAAWLQGMLRCVEAKLRGFTNGTMLSSVLWSLAVLQHAPSGEWMEHFAWQVQRMRNRCDAQNLSVIAWSLASLRYRPHPKWLETFLKAAVARMEERPGRIALDSGAAASQGGIQRGRGALAPRALSHQLRRQQQQDQQHAVGPSPQASSNLLWALAKLKLRPRGAILKRLCAAVQHQLPRFSARDLVHTLWSLQRLRFLPDPEWMMELQMAMEAKMGQFDVPCLVMALAAYGGYRHASANPAGKAMRGHIVLIQVRVYAPVRNKFSTSGGGSALRPHVAAA